MGGSCRKNVIRGNGMKRTLCTLALCLFIAIGVVVGSLGAECTADVTNAQSQNFALASLLSPSAMAVAGVPMMLIGWFGTRRRI